MRCLKPAGLDVGPIIPIADVAALEEALVAAVQGPLAERFRHLGHGLYQATRAPGHVRGHTHE